MYLRGKGVEKDVKKAIELFERAASSDISTALEWLGYIYKESLEIPSDFKKSANYFARAMELGNKDSEKYVIEIMEKNKIEWQPILHKLWVSKENVKGKIVALNEQVLTLLLISKFRSKNDSARFLVKGIVMKVIKALCEIRQLLRK